MRKTFNFLNFMIFAEGADTTPCFIRTVIKNHTHSIFYSNTDENLTLILLKNLDKTGYTRGSITFFSWELDRDALIFINSLSEIGTKISVINRGMEVYKISFHLYSIFLEIKCFRKLIPIPIEVLSSWTNEDLNTIHFPLRFIKKSNWDYKGQCPNLNFFDDTRGFFYYKSRTFDLREEIIKYANWREKLFFTTLSKAVAILSNLYFEKSLKYCNSLPSFAYRLFFSKYAPPGVEKFINANTHKYIKNSFFGGRCEIFGNEEKGEITHYFDFTGMYAKSMEEDFPIGSPQFVIKPSDFSEMGFYYINFEQNLEKPFLPTKINNQLLFLNGKMSGLYYFEEILKFIELGGQIISIEYALLYYAKEKIFKKFIQDINMVKEKGLFAKAIGKILINSLYGSFGVNDTNSITEIIYSEEEFFNLLQNSEVKSFTKTSAFYFVELVRDKGADHLRKRNISYASIITSKARIRLYSAFIEVEKKGGRLLYCDTDSIFAAFKENRLGFRDGEEILWSEIFSKTCFILPRLYALKREDSTEFKVKNLLKFNLSYEDLENIFYKIELNSSYSLDRDGKYIWVDKYNKRIFLKGKKRTTPWSITNFPTL